MQIWLTKHLPRKWIEESLDPLCGTKTDIKNEPMRYHPWLVQKLQLKQPSKEALALLYKVLGKADHVINMVELSADFCFPDPGTKYRFYRLFDERSLRRYRRLAKAIRRKYYPMDKDGRDRIRYDGDKGTFLALYPEHCCRLTGELDCLHFDWRVKTKAACQEIRIETIGDALRFDHETWWTNKLDESFHLYEVDLEALGRARRNRIERTKDQSPRIEMWGPLRMNIDRRLGGWMARHALDVGDVDDDEKERIAGLRDGASIDELMRAYGTHFVRRICRNVPVGFSSNESTM